MAARAASRRALQAEATEAAEEGETAAAELDAADAAIVVDEVAIAVGVVVK